MQVDLQPEWSALLKRILTHLLVHRTDPDADALETRHVTTKLVSISAQVLGLSASLLF